ncbi:MAG: hypothetical protein ACOX5G_02865 [Kiritimatiellia bacterium]|jgi:hypothetical protein
MKKTLRMLLAAIVASTCALRVHAQQLVLQDNLERLDCEAPDMRFRFLSSGAPGQLFFPGESPTLQLDFERAAFTGGNAAPLSIEIREIDTRRPGERVKDMAGLTDTSGMAPCVTVGPVLDTVAIAPPEGGGERVAFAVKDFPLPDRFGTYALVLVRGDAERRFLATMARVPRPNPKGTVDNTYIFGEAVMIGPLGERADIYARMGVRGFRCETGWNEQEDGTIDWSRYDTYFAAMKEAGCQVMVTLGGHPMWTRPFHEPTPAARWTPQTGGYGGTGDWLCAPANDERYGKWIEQFAARYWEDGKGGLWGLENYNEPWEGGGISGWASDCLRYRDLQKLIATSARKTAPGIRILAASSIMNTEDKLFSDGSPEFESYVDIFTDHYVVPAMCYGPMVARSRGKGSIETETWFVGTEYQLAQGVVQFLAAGQNRISPWHPRVLFDTLPGHDSAYVIPTPVVAATAAFNAMTSGKPFRGMVFTEHLPFAFQFGEDDDPEGVVVVFGKLVPIGGTSYRMLPWAQVNGSDGGTLALDNSDGLLSFYDMEGNPGHVGETEVVVPMDIAPLYVGSAKGPAAINERLRAARIAGKRGIEIIPRDFSSRVDAEGARLVVELRNRLNAPLAGNLAIAEPDGIRLASSAAPVELAPGESRRLEFPVAEATPSPANAYLFRFSFQASTGETAAYAEVLSAAIAPRRTIAVDGDLADWADVPGVTALYRDADQSGDFTEQMRRPWLDLRRDHPEATSGELKLAWDDDFVYVCAQVNDPTPEPNAYRWSERDEDSFFHSAADDGISPYKEFIEAFRAKTGDPARSFGEVPHVYRKYPEIGMPIRRDRLHIAFDTTPGFHDLEPIENLPEGFTATPDTDYEYAIYWVDDGRNGNGETWRYLAPGVPRIHDFPRQKRGERTTGVVPGATQVVIRTDTGYLYEAAIPRTEIPDLPKTVGEDFGFTFLIGNQTGRHAAYGADKAGSKFNGLTLHPYWESSPGICTRWTLVE